MKPRSIISGILTGIMLSSLTLSIPANGSSEPLSIEEAVKYNESVGPGEIDPAVKTEIAEWHKKVSIESQQLIRPDGQKLLLDETDVPKGTDFEFYAASEGNKWIATWGIAWGSSNYYVAVNENDMYEYSAGIGSADAWAWTGKRFNVTGSGSQAAYIDFDGTGAASLLGSYTGNAHWEVEITVYDATAATYIARSTILSETSTNNWAKYPNTTYSESLYVSLQAGHQYVVQVITYGTVDEYGLGISDVDADDSTYHTDWDEIAIRWQ